jgi:hypothetical protein
MRIVVAFVAVDGTHAGMRNERVAPNPLAESAGVDARRAKMGMTPLGDYVRPTG